MIVINLRPQLLIPPSSEELCSLSISMQINYPNRRWFSGVVDSATKRGHGIRMTQVRFLAGQCFFLLF